MSQSCMRSSEESMVSPTGVSVTCLIPVLFEGELAGFLTDPRGGLFLEYINYSLL